MHRSLCTSQVQLRFGHLYSSLAVNFSEPTQLSQAVRVGTNSRFLNRIFQNPNSKCLLGCAQTPFVLHRADAGGAFVPNAFITKRRDKTRVLLKERTLVCRRLSRLFSVLLFSSVRPDHIAGQGDQLFYHQSHKERCREGDNLFQRRQHIEHKPYTLEEKVDALRIKIQNCYATQVTQLKECKDIIAVNACGQRRAELLIKLLESVGCLKLSETFCNESRKINKEVVEKIQTILDGTRLNVIRKDMSLYEIDQELSVQLKRATELCETYQNGKYTVQDYKELKYVYRKCI